MDYLQALKNLESPQPPTDKTDKTPDSDSSVSFVSAPPGAFPKNSDLAETLERLTEGHQFSARAAFDALSPEDVTAWNRGEIPDSQLQAFVSALEGDAMRREGIQPPHYTHPAHCARCGPVWLWGAGNALACPWCANRLAGRPIPRPEPVRCADCRHYTPDAINPPGGRGTCALKQSGTWPGSDCPQYETKP